MHLSPPVQPTVQVRLLAGALTLGVLGLATAAQAETTRIVAIGASNTSGVAVGASAAWPALLEGMLKAKGYDVSVINLGVNCRNQRRDFGSRRLGGYSGNEDCHF
jgi:hypothetical protein